MPTSDIEVSTTSDGIIGNDGDGQQQAQPRDVLADVLEPHLAPVRLAVPQNSE